MHVVYSCTRCGRSATASLLDGDVEVQCPHCESVIRASAPPIQAGRLERCAVCPGTELFVRKDFPQRLGVTIVVIGFALSCVAWYQHRILTTFAILFATALIDVILYLCTGDLLECYRCHAQYRGGVEQGQYAAFDLEKHEKYRQMKARQPSQGEP